MTLPETDLIAAHCPGCAGWIEPEYLRREDCPGLSREAGLDEDLLARCIKDITYGGGETLGNAWEDARNIADLYRARLAATPEEE